MSARDTIEGDMTPLLGMAAVAGSVRTAMLVAVRTDGTEPVVACVARTGQTLHSARTTTHLVPADIGGEVLIVFDGNVPERPVIIGVIRDRQGVAEGGRDVFHVEADGRRLSVQACRELVLRCGAASITLDSSGRITLRGRQIVSHADGLNRIRGGSVHLN